MLIIQHKFNMNHENMTTCKFILNGFNSIIDCNMHTNLYSFCYIGYPIIIPNFLNTTISNDNRFRG